MLNLHISCFMFQYIYRLYLYKSKSDQLDLVLETSWILHTFHPNALESHIDFRHHIIFSSFHYFLFSLFIDNFTQNRLSTIWKSNYLGLQVATNFLFSIVWRSSWNCLHFPNKKCVQTIEMSIKGLYYVQNYTIFEFWLNSFIFIK